MSDLEQLTYICQVVTYKDGEDEEFCPQTAVTQIGMPDDEGLIIVYVCQEHEDRLDNGEALYFATFDDARILIELGEEEDVASSQPSS